MFLKICIISALKLMKTESVQFSFQKLAEWIHRQKLSQLLKYYKNKFITKQGTTAFLKTVEELGRGQEEKEGKKKQGNRCSCWFWTLCSGGKEN